jgi:prolyl oligopeptidase
MSIAPLLLALCSVASLDSSPDGGAGRTPTTFLALPDDPYAWLERIDDSTALDWVKARNAEAMKELVATPDFEHTRTQILEVLDSDARIPYLGRMGRLYYNFWQDKAHVRGLWRRTTLAEYRKPKPRWETIIDVDALAAKDKENWIWHGAVCLKPEYRHCIVYLSRGGADADVVREFDLKTKSFVSDGFALPEAKSRVDWLDADSVFVGTDFGPGSMTTSGYPRISKIWKRGTPLDSATTIFEGEPGDVSVGADRDHTAGFQRDFVNQRVAFFSVKRYLRDGDGKLRPIEIPLDAKFSIEREWMLVEPRTPWTVGEATYAPGTLLAARFDDYMSGKRDLAVVFRPTSSISLRSYSWTRHHLVLNLLDDVSSAAVVLTPPAPGAAVDAWTQAPLKEVPKLTTASVYGTDPDQDDEYFFHVESFLQPPTLSRGELGPSGLPTGAPSVLKHAPHFFDAKGDQVDQYFVHSKDGTRIPYFVVRSKAPKTDSPTLLVGYGGFESSWTPGYNAVAGRAWLAHGGTYVVANIRGGGEYGPKWHLDAVKEKRLRAYEDFAAVAQDLAARGISSPQRLGIQGASNGGLLVGNMYTQYPELFGAIVCQVPLLDMKRYTHLSAGASWIAEYGDPDKPDEWAFIQTFSPYQNVRPSVHYPPLLLTTSTRDDRVGPVHARKMAAKLRDLGADVRLYENIEGGHAAAANHIEQAFMAALGYTFLWKELGPKSSASDARDP